MPRSYRHISDYEKEIIEKFNSGESLKRHIFVVPF